MDGSALSRHFAVLGNLVQSGAGVAPVLAEGCSVGKSEAPRIAVFNHVVQGAARALESHGFRLFFSFSASTFLSLAHSRARRWGSYWLMSGYGSSLL